MQVLEETPIKSENDKKDYRIIILSNELKAILISDPTPNPNEAEDETEEQENEDENGYGKSIQSKKEKSAACALSVAVGSTSDPQEIQGLAHFVGMFAFYCFISLAN